MKLVVNTSRIIAALIKDSISRKIITHSKAELITIRFSEKEIKKYKKIILKKAKINETEFNMSEIYHQSVTDGRKSNVVAYYGIFPSMLKNQLYVRNGL